MVENEAKLLVILYTLAFDQVTLVCLLLSKAESTTN